MRVSFKRFDEYPGLDLQVEIHETLRRPGVRPRVSLQAHGPVEARNVLLKDLVAWLKKGRLRPRTRRWPESDDHEIILRGWGQTMEFVAMWLGEATLSRMLDDTSSLAHKHNAELWGIRRELEALNAAIAEQNRRLSAAAARFVADVP